MVAPSELITDYDIPVDEKMSLSEDWWAEFLPTLHGQPPICVLRLVADTLVSLWDLKSLMFGGGSAEC
jgi:hypothetical protein